MRVGKMFLMAMGVVVLIIGLIVTAAGAGLLWANATQRDSTGYFNTPYATFESSGAALVSSVDFTLSPGPNDWLSHHPLGTLRLRADVKNGGTFVGIAPTAAVDKFLSGVAYDQVRSVRIAPYRVDYRNFVGSRSATNPTTQQIWTASASGTGEQQITWRPESGNWSLVVMRADAGSGVSARVAVGTNTGYVLPVGVGLTVGGVLLIMGGGLMLGLAIIGLERSRRRELASGAGGVVGATTQPLNPDAYPVRLDGRLDSPLSRWRWLVKWILIVPHAIVVAFLWMAVMPLTLVAGIWILFTGRYPEPIFDFTVGVIRWTWRIGFYAFSALGTDRYPPFSLEPDDSFPAAFAVDYPPRLSRGLVLVKWWLLAIPQYLIVALFMGGGIGFSSRWSTNWSCVVGGGVIGILVCAAGVMLLFTGSYPQAVFDLVMGLNRWCYRVLAYVLLLRDEYPPFRLDTGGVDPGNIAPSSVTPPPSEPGPVGAVPNAEASRQS